VEKNFFFFIKENKILENLQKLFFLFFNLKINKKEWKKKKNNLKKIIYYIFEN
jgi:hypothetical protein